MKAVILTKPTESREIKITEYPTPAVKPGLVLVRIKSFGMNHSEQILRKSEISAPYIQKPIIPGIECAGEIADASDTAFTAGQKVIALMGGMGREFNGSYAEYALLPAHHVFAADTNLSWNQLAAIPETYFTAWGSLFECLSLKSSDHLLVRGGTCALGYAVIQIAKAFGCKVTATTHRESKMQLLTDCGADMALLDNGSLKGQVSGITKALDNDIFAFLDAHNLTPHIGKCYLFTDIAKACEDMENGKINGKIVIDVNGGGLNA